MAGTSRRPHVVMSQRRDVGSTNIKVNKRQRRDVSTSRRLNIATSQRRDVSASFVFSTLKEKKGVHNFRYQELYERGRKNQSSSDPEQRRRAHDLYFPLSFGQ